jgi:hypothetical protein
MYVFSETEKWCLSRFGQSRLISSDAIAGDNNDLRRFTFRLGKDQGAWTSRHHRGSETPRSKLRRDLSRLPEDDFAIRIEFEWHRAETAHVRSFHANFCSSAKAETVTRRQDGIATESGSRSGPETGNGRFGSKAKPPVRLTRTFTGTIALSERVS